MVVVVVVVVVLVVVVVVAVAVAVAAAAAAVVVVAGLLHWQVWLWFSRASASYTTCGMSHGSLFHWPLNLGFAVILATPIQVASEILRSHAHTHIDLKSSCMNLHDPRAAQFVAYAASAAKIMHNMPTPAYAPSRMSTSNHLQVTSHLNLYI